MGPSIRFLGFTVDEEQLTEPIIWRWTSQSQGIGRLPILHLIYTRYCVCAILGVNALGIAIFLPCWRGCLLASMVSTRRGCQSEYGPVQQMRNSWKPLQIIQGRRFIWVVAVLISWWLVLAAPEHSCTRYCVWMPLNNVCCGACLGMLLCKDVILFDLSTRLSSWWLVLAAQDCSFTRYCVCGIPCVNAPGILIFSPCWTGSKGSFCSRPWYSDEEVVVSLNTGQTKCFRQCATGEETVENLCK
jgi:hypothetical protein